MQHVMLDLETMGTAPGCAIVSIGAVAFDSKKGKLGDTFYRAVSLESCQEFGLKIEGGAVNWWLAQSEAARQALLDPARVTLDVALNDLSAYWAEQEATYVWAHGASFDPPITEMAYRAVGPHLDRRHLVKGKAQAPWEFWNARDTRTLFDIAGVRPSRAKGTHHNALDDAINQAEDAIAAFRNIRMGRVN